MKSTASNRLLAGALAAALLGPFASAQELSLATIFDGGNNRDGNMFEVVAFRDLTITRIDGHFSAGALSAEVYYKVGTMVGFEGDPPAWTFGGQVAITGQGVGVPTPIPIPIDLDLKGGEMAAIYLTNTGGTNPNAHYTDGFGQIYVNGDMAILQGHGVEYPFGSTFTPRIWNGIVYYTAPGLTGTPDQLSVSAGGVQDMRLTAGIPNADLPYLLLGSALGTSPGIVLDGVTLPLMPDAYFTTTLLAPNTPPLSNSFGTLDGQALATAQLTLPPGLPAALVGQTLNHAYVVIELTPTLLEVVYASDPLPLSLIP